ncbi:hypothetical protein TRAPUB_11600, partial [Trametes pubescens]
MGDRRQDTMRKVKQIFAAPTNPITNIDQDLHVNKHGEFINNNNPKPPVKTAQPKKWGHPPKKHLPEEE